MVSVTVFLDNKLLKTRVFKKTVESCGIVPDSLISFLCSKRQCSEDKWFRDLSSSLSFYIFCFIIRSEISVKCQVLRTK